MAIALIQVTEVNRIILKLKNKEGNNSKTATNQKTLTKIKIITNASSFLFIIC